MLSLIIAFVLVLGANAKADDVYKYVDKNGVVLFTDCPPPGASQVYRQQKKAAAEEKTLKPVLASRKSDMEDLILRKCDLYEMDPQLVKAVIRAESGYNRDAVSVKGAMGLMQLMPGTASLMGVYHPFNAEENIDGGIRYLKSLMGKFGDLNLALAAYNAGPRTVEKLGAVPPYKETRMYVKKVISMYKGKDGQLVDTDPGKTKKKATVKKKDAVIFKVVMDDGTVVYTNSVPRF
jgi:hypothetical protein